MEKSQIIPVFMSDASLSKSILTADDPAEIQEDAPVSIWSIAKEHKIDTVYLLETSFVNFINHYKNAEKLKKQLIFGIKFKIVSDSKDLSENSLFTESNICVWMKNSEGYKDLIRLYSAAHADKERFYYTGRLDWQLLKNTFTDNLLVTIPFYKSFLARNLLEYNHRAVPEFGNINIKPIFHLESHELPFDDLIEKQILSFCEANNYQTLNTHQIYYYRNSDITPYLTFRCIHNRSKFESPNLSHMSSDKFSFESYLNKTKETIDKSRLLV